MEINEKRVNLQIRNFEKALNGYNYDEPLSRYLTRFFKDNKQMGSSDRRMTSRFCYNYFRLGNALKDYSVLDRLVFATFLCEAESALVWMLKPDLGPFLQDSLEDKVNLLTQRYGFDIVTLFPLVDHLSEAIDVVDFVKSQCIQPDLFIRMVKGKEDLVRNVFQKNDIVYQAINANTLALANGTNLQKVTNIEGKYEVQDLSSQKTIDFIEANVGENWWDACAASGGKALMFLDKFPKTNLLVSDIRMSILRNLDERFERAGIRTSYRKKILDLSHSVEPIMRGEKFDGIILDAPCSGSGTWGRTPEMIQQFTIEKLDKFVDLQKRIASNVIPYLKTGGTLVYITCSVYSDENENVVRYLLDNFKLRLDKMEVIKGYHNKADSMFAARFIKG